MQRLLVLQSMWAMERRQADGAERTLEQNVEMILAAGYDGISASFTDAGAARRIAALIKPHGKVLEGQCFPRTIDELEPALELCTELGVHHLDIQADVRPRRIDDCVPLIEGWLRLAEEVDFPVYFETHRDRMTTDLYFTLDLLDRFPDLKLLGDLSHFLVGREFATPISEENHAYMHRVIDNCWAFHGRVASREQVQIEISFRITGCGSKSSWSGGSTDLRAGAVGRTPTTPCRSCANSARGPMLSPAATATTRPIAGWRLC